MWGKAYISGTFKRSLVKKGLGADVPGFNLPSARHLVVPVASLQPSALVLIDWR